MKYGKESALLERSEQTRLKAVICGSFRRNPTVLRNEFQELRETGCAVLSPREPDFVAEVDGFVYGSSDLGRTSADVEHNHLDAMQRADLVWLHCPEGYVGTSAAMELGFARALGLRVFAAQRPEDVTLADLVTVCNSPAEAVSFVSRQLGDAPSDGLLSLQSYYARAAQMRGWSEESADTALQLLRGELGELEAALGDGSKKAAAALELADVQLYVVHLANILGLDLGDAVRDKEKINSERFDSAGLRMAA